MKSTTDKVALLICVAFTAAQLVILALFGYTPYPDSDGYWLLAEDSLRHGEPYPVVSKLHEMRFLWNIGAVQLPELSLFLFGSITPLLVVYSILKGFTAWLLYDITKNILKTSLISYSTFYAPRSTFHALIPLILYILYPANYGESTSLLSELPFTFFMMLAVCCFVRRKFFLSGILLAVGNWIRPFGLIFLSAFILVWIIESIIHKKGNSAPCSTLHAPRLLLSYLLTLALIGSINYARTGLFFYQATTGWMSLTEYGYSLQGKTIQIEDADQYDILEKDAVWRKYFIRWIKENPKEYLREVPLKIARTYVSDNVNMCAFLPDKAERTYLYEELSMRSLKKDFPCYTAVQTLTVCNLAFYFLLWFLALAGCVTLIRRRNIRPLVLPLSVLVCGTAFLALAGHGETRFHIPFMPFVILLAGYSFLYCPLKNEKNRLD